MKGAETKAAKIKYNKKVHAILMKLLLAQPKCKVKNVKFTQKSDKNSLK